MPTWRDLRQKMRNCLTSANGTEAGACGGGGGMNSNGGLGTNVDLNDDVFVEFKQVIRTHQVLYLYSANHFKIF